MSRKFLTGLDLNKNQLENARIQNLATAPSNPVTGLFYFDTVATQLKVYDGTAWVALAAGGNVTEAINQAIADLDLANTYDAIGAAATAEADANDYTDTLIGDVTVDGTSGNTVTSRIATAKSEAISDASDYADGLASNYDAAGAAATAQSNAETFATNAINALDTDDIEEGLSNLYYTTSRAKTDAAALLTGATKTNITITGDVTAENDWIFNTGGSATFLVPVVINENAGSTQDFRAESATEANMLFLDASANTLYLGGTTNGIAIEKGGVFSFIAGGTGKIKGGTNIPLDTTTGTKIGTGTTQKLGFWNATPIVRPSAFTQTYSTASKTHANLTYSAPAAYGAGANGYSTAAMASAVHAAVIALAADVANVKQVLNSVIDDLQSMGLLA